jgi:hypothetical protein
MTCNTERFTYRIKKIKEYEIRENSIYSHMQTRLSYTINVVDKVTGRQILVYLIAENL